MPPIARVISAPFRRVGRILLSIGRLTRRARGLAEEPPAPPARAEPSTATHPYLRSMTEQAQQRRDKAERDKADEPSDPPKPSDYINP